MKLEVHFLKGERPLVYKIDTSKNLVLEAFS